MELKKKMSNIAMNNPNFQRRVLNPMHYQPMAMLSNQYSVPLPPNQNQERNPESKINLAFGLLRKNTARTNGIWKVIQSLISKIKKLEESTAMIDQVIKRNKELEEKRSKNNRKKNEKKRSKRMIRQEQRKKLKEGKIQIEQKEKEVKEVKDECKNILNEVKEEKKIELGPKYKKEERTELEGKMTNSRNFKESLEISRKKFDSRKNKNDSIDNLEISRTNLINKKIINKNINNKKKINNKDEISFGGNQLMDYSKEDECSLQLNDKINQSNEKLSKNGRNKQNVINLVNRFIINNKNIYNSNQKWIYHTFIPLIEDIMDLNIDDIDISDYIRKVRTPPEFRKRFWEWWKNRDLRKQAIEIHKISQKLKQDPELKKLIWSTETE